MGNVRKIREKCHLQEANGLDAWCSREQCIYWRLIEEGEGEVTNNVGCGLRHYEIVEAVSPDTAKWLLSMKKRLENTTPDTGKARITFRRRENK